ncbi:MAG: glycosyltransferase [Solirubrobacteraceae bacterium]|nr:glycosyltransferase [Solirubrobacteraceae bacterium]
MTGATTPDPTGAPLRVCVVAEFYPRAHDPVLGIWAHRQAVAARDAGAEVEVLVLHRPVPPAATRLRDLPRTLRTMLAQPPRTTLDGIPVTYVRFLSPRRSRSYGRWGRYAARPLRRALRRLHRRFPFDVVHAHNAVPAGDALRRIGRPEPVVLSVHGGDVYFTADLDPDARTTVRDTLAGATLVLANSAGTADRCAALGATRTRVVHLGTDLPDRERLRAWDAGRTWSAPAAADATVDERSEGRWGRGQLLRRPTAEVASPQIVTVGHLVARKRHADVLRAIWMLRERHPGVRYAVVGDGPERATLTALAESLGIDDRVRWCGQLPHDEALEAARAADLFVMPAVDEAFGVAYVEAMAACIPAVGALGEAGPAEIADAGDGIVLVPPADVEALARTLDRLLRDPVHRRELGRAARRTVERAFTWDRCGAATVRAYRDALADATDDPR